MKMLRRSVCLLLCAALFLTLLAGCGKQEEPAEDFVVSAAVCGPLETLDPTMNTDVGAESLLSTLFEGLMRMRDDGAGKAVAVAGIAKEYIEEKNYDDTVTYTFTLRSAARWSDGGGLRLRLAAPGRSRDGVAQRLASEHGRGL